IRGAARGRNKQSSKSGGEARGFGSYTALTGPRWQAVLQQLMARMDEEEVTPAVREKVEAEMAATLDEVKNARAVMDRAETLIAGARAAKDAAKEAAKQTAKEAGKDKKDATSAAKQESAG